MENLWLYKLPGEMSLTDGRVRIVLWMKLMVSLAAMHDFLSCSDMCWVSSCSLLLSLTHQHFESCDFKG